MTAVSGSSGSPLTLPQRRALTILTRHAAHVIGRGHPLGRLNVSYTVAEALCVLGHARPVGRPADAPQHVVDAIVITTAGRAALARPVEEVPVFLKQRNGLTTTPGKAVRGEAEVIDPDTLDAFWANRSLTGRAEAEGRREQARRLARATRRAA
jgi:hypothetical protein